jgi:histidinol-phosphate aminotransferase
MIKPSPAIEGAAEYKVPRPAGTIDLFLDGNEGLAPPSFLVEILRRYGPGLLRRYPSTRALEAVIASRLRLDPAQVLVTAGADDSLFRACHAVLAPGREVVCPAPTFEMIPRYARLAGGALIKVPWEDGGFPADDVLRTVGANTAAIFVVSPNNPTGLVARAAEIERLSREAQDALIVADLAYVEFASEDPMQAVLKLPNAVVLRSFSKAWGLAGLRMGYAAGPKEIIGWLRAAGSPYAVSGPSIEMTMAWLKTGDQQVKDFIARVRKEREELATLLVRLGAKPFASEGNFAFARFVDTRGVWEGLARHGIAVRAFPDHKGIEDCLRITCPGDQRQFERLCSALSKVMGGRKR